MNTIKDILNKLSKDGKIIYIENLIISGEKESIKSNMDIRNSENKKEDVKVDTSYISSNGKKRKLKETFHDALVDYKNKHGTRVEFKNLFEFSSKHMPRFPYEQNDRGIRLFYTYLVYNAMKAGKLESIDNHKTEAEYEILI